MLSVLTGLVLISLAFNLLNWFELKTLKTALLSIHTATSPKVKNPPTGKLELCQVGDHLAEDVKMTKEGRAACKHCRVVVLKLPS